jgi:dTDP-4-dehydrorhamnose reductase
MRIAVTGTQGQVARSLIERGKAAGVDVVALGRPALDLAAPSSLLPALREAAPDMIVSAAAYTAVDLAETEEGQAQRINAEGAGAVAAAAHQLGSPVLHLSTDYVFDGTLDRPYRESDPTGPISAYGRSKLAGESAVREATPRHVILRTAWVYSPFGKNFLRTMLALGETRPTIGVVADQLGQPTSALDIADGILAICDRLGKGPDEQMYGTFHMAGIGGASWADFAEAIFAEATRCGRPAVSVTRIATKDYKTAARRPANSRLDTTKLAETYGVVLPPWRNALPAIVERVLASG